MTRAKVVPQHQDSNGWWEVLPDAPAARKLEGAQRYRTVIIGGGVCGLSVARRLAELRPGERIALLEAERVGYGASGRNAGFMLDMHAHGEVKHPEVLKCNAELWNSGINDLRRIVRDYQIQCDWSEWGRLYGSAGDSGEGHLDSLAATLERMDLPFEWRPHAQMQADLGTSFYRRGIHVPGSALVNPAAMMRGLAQALPDNVDVFEETPVHEFARGGGGFSLWTPNGTIDADQVVVATGVFMQHLGVAHNRYVGLALFASLTERIPEEKMGMFGIGNEFGLLASSDNGATVRLTRDRRIFFRNVTHYAPGHPPTSQAVAKAAAQHRQGLVNRWPEFRDLAFAHSWSGIMAFTTNDGAVFGEMEPGLFAILTHDVSPMTRGAASGRLLAELIEGQDSELLSTVMNIPMAKRLPPRPFLDLGVAWRLHKVRSTAPEEF